MERDTDVSVEVTEPGEGVVLVELHGHVVAVGVLGDEDEIDPTWVIATDPAPGAHQQEISFPN